MSRPPTEKLKSLVMPQPVLLMNRMGRGRPSPHIEASEELELVREGAMVTARLKDGTEFRLAGWLLATPMQGDDAK